MARGRTISIRSRARSRYIPETPRNLIIVVAHGMDGRALGCAGHPAAVTPHMDRLAARGMLFPDAYCGTPSSRGSIAALLQGRYVHEFDGWQFPRRISPPMGFLDVLDEAGYEVAWWDALGAAAPAAVRDEVAAWTATAPIARPVYRMGLTGLVDDESDRVHGADWEHAEACADWVASRPAGRPFAAFLHLSVPSPRSRTSWHWLNRILASRVPIPPVAEAEHPFDLHMRRQKNWVHGTGEEVIRLVRRVHLATVAEFDAMVGRITAAVEAAGRGDDTYIVVTAEHGEMALEHGQVGAGGLYEPSIRVPLIVAGPDVLADRRGPSAVSLVDIYPTVMDLAALPLPADLPGHSLMPACRTLVSKRPRWVFSEAHGATACTGGYVLRRGEWKLIAYGGLQPQLFHLREDPWESRNCAGSRRDMVGELGDILLDLCAPESIENRVRAWGRASFGDWREGQLAAGTYGATMARVFSGWDNLADGDIRPWSDADERQLADWLDEGRH